MTLLDELKRVVDLDKIEKCYMMDDYNKYTVNLDLNETFKLLDNIIPNDELGLIDIRFKTKDEIIICEEFLYGDDYPFFKVIKINEPKAVATIKPDTLFNTFTHTLEDGKEYELPLKNREQKFIDLIGPDNELKFRKNKYNLNIAKSIDWLEKVGIEIFNNEEISAFRDIDNFRTLKDNYGNKYIILPNDFDLDKIEERIAYITANIEGNYVDFFNWFDLFLDKDFSLKEDMYYKLARMLDCKATIDLVDNNKNEFILYTFDSDVEKATKIIFENLIRIGKVKRAILILKDEARDMDMLICDLKKIYEEN